MKYLRLYEEFSNNTHGWGLHLKSSTEVAKYYTSGLQKWVYEPTLLNNLKLEDWDEKPSNFLLGKIESEFHSNKFSTTYRLLSNKLGSDKETSNFLLELGVDGHRYKGQKNDDNFIIYDSSRLNESINNEPLKYKLASQYPITIDEYNYLLSELYEHNVYISVSRMLIHKKNEFKYTLLVANANGVTTDLMLRWIFRIEDKSIIKKAIKEGNLELRDVISVNSNEPFEEEVLPLIEKLLKKLNHFGYAIMQKEKEFSNRIPGYDIIVQFDKTVVTLD